MCVILLTSCSTTDFRLKLDRHFDKAERKEYLDIYYNFEYTKKDKEAFLNGDVSVGMPKEMVMYLYNIPNSRDGKKQKFRNVYPRRKHKKYKRKDIWAYKKKGIILALIEFKNDKVFSIWKF
jgi:hypothetical protein